MAWLSLVNICSIGGTYALCSAIYQIVHYHFFHPLVKFPGPFWAGVTRLWLAYHNLAEDELETFGRLHDRPVVRITPTLLLVQEAKYIPAIYNRRANKSSFYITGSWGKVESLFNIREAAAHARARKIIAVPYSFGNIQKMEPLVDEQVQNWIDKIDMSFAATNKEFNFVPWAFYLAYDVVSSVGFGAPIGFIEQARDLYGLVRCVGDGMPIFGLISILWPFTEWVKTTYLGRFLVSSPQDKAGFGVALRLRDDVVEQRLRDAADGKVDNRRDFLYNFLEARDSEGKPLDIEYVKAEAFLTLIAGGNTVGSSINSFLQNILTRPEIYEKLMAEVDGAARAGKLSDMPQYTEVMEHCPYYVACLRECMRIDPEAQTTMPRLVPAGGMELYGRFVPEGTELTCSPWFAHRDTSIFGDDVESFRPERWMDPRKTVEYLKYSMNFGSGVRSCLGKELAMMELFKGPMVFLRSFRVTFLDERQPGTLALGAIAAAVLSTAGQAAAKGQFSLDSDGEKRILPVWGADLRLSPEFKAASTLAHDLLQYYHGNETGGIPGLLPGPPPAGEYYWYQSAVMWAALIEYRHATGDQSYNKVITDGLAWQAGNDHNFMPMNQTAAMGNDDQGFWALAAMLAAERGLPNPPAGQPQWLNLSRNVFGNLVDRWDDKTCGGGLRWQIASFNNGYDYKNSISNGVFFSLGAQLARYTGNKTYADWADKTWDWMAKVGLLDAESFAIYDGAHVADNCGTTRSKAEFSNVNAVFTVGAAYMYNYTDGDSKWQKRVDGLVGYGLKTFFPKGVATERACEASERCTLDMKMFKGQLHQWYATTMQVAPWTAGKIAPVLKTSARAAVAQCTGGDGGSQCGFSWANGTYDDDTGASQEMSVLSAVNSVLLPGTAAPLTAKTGGSSGNGDDAGSGGGSKDGNGGNNGTSTGGGDGDSAKKDGSSAGVKEGVAASALAVLALSCLLAL
ncbi:hypothetical protein O9K51_07156 [Purpureocillium lavendulum]|uniref:mannan endo-1,6-alpha-mannosidase n=1 Tax=Purpureocillium lavendulum TaxID=1247861 RepID=A0AB34FLI7_9HYPO|nr:hypothetical protein O9K51_07156 [Purpureocillium lavendulum]